MINELPDNEAIINWANEAPLSRGHEHLDMSAREQCKYLQGRCDGARWMKEKVIKLFEENKQTKLF